MIRILTIATVFLAITVGLLVLQPGTGPDRRQQATASTPAPQPAPPQIQVSRAETDLAQLIGTDTASAAPTPAPANPLDRLGQAVALASRPAAPQPTPAMQGNTNLHDLTQGVLAELGATPAAQPSAEMRNMTSGVLAALTAASGTGGAADGTPQSLETIIVQALRQGESDDYIDALLNEAAGRGQIDVPAALVTASGRVDTATLLATLVQKSQPHSARNVAPELLAGLEQVEKRNANGDSEQVSVYTVQPGDSLGAIAVKFYGDAGMYSAIFNANRGVLSSPDRIHKGQRLTIPAPGTI